MPVTGVYHNNSIPRLAARSAMIWCKTVRRTPIPEREKALALYRSTYRSFGPTLWAEKLGKDHGIWVSHDTARRWLMEEGLLEKFCIKILRNTKELPCLAVLESDLLRSQIQPRWF